MTPMTPGGRPKKAIARLRAKRARKGSVGWLPRFATLGFVVAVLAGLAELLAGFGYQWGWWHYQTGFTILRSAAPTALGAALVALIGCFATRGHRVKLIAGLVGIAIGVAAFALPYSVQLSRPRGLPSINDITTDTADPPKFVALIPLRKGATTSPDYGGDEVAEVQRRAYPNIAPIDRNVAPNIAFEMCLEAAQALGWEVVTMVPPEGRIEAVATSWLFGFKDDVVIRITPRDGGSRIDIRSKSRLGRNDYGANARRIGAFEKKLRAE